MGSVEPTEPFSSPFSPPLACAPGRADLPGAALVYLDGYAVDQWLEVAPRLLPMPPQGPLPNNVWPSDLSTDRKIMLNDGYSVT
jgi:hypothetical protein